MTCTISDPKPPSSITFYQSEDKWIMKITEGKDGPVILFNTQDYPNCLPGEFAQAVAEILCMEGQLRKTMEKLNQKTEEEK